MDFSVPLPRLSPDATCKFWQGGGEILRTVSYISRPNLQDPTKGLKKGIEFEIQAVFTTDN